MNCRKARTLMHQMLDGVSFDRDELDRHLAECPDCRAELHRLQQAQSAVQAAVRGPVDEESLERATAGILQAVEKDSAAPAARTSRRAQALAGVAVALLLAFSVGVWAGRSVWPREAIVSEVVKVPKIVEKLVEVGVPVVKERVVVKEVTVIKERVVYRERPQPPEQILVAAEPEPAKLGEIVIHLDVPPLIPPPVVTEEIRPARIVGEHEPEPEAIETDDGGQNAAPAEQAADENMLAQRLVAP